MLSTTRAAYYSGRVAVTGAHMLLYTPEAERLRGTLRDVFGWGHVDAGDGWLIFALPPAELGVHPSDGDTHHELSLMCDDIGATLEELRGKGLEVRGEPEDHGFGIGTTIVLPGGVELLLYEPRHPTGI
jgi:catechol 2,3-dioxygenase-like lactoylglutathione lyase family enzyme